MTVNEMFYVKYLRMMKTMNSVTWNNFKANAETSGKHMAELMYMSLEITVNDIKENGGWNSELYDEIKQMHSAKLLASNKHRQAHGQVDAYWLTKKGFRAINRDHAIC